MVAVMWKPLAFCLGDKIHLGEGVKGGEAPQGVVQEYETRRGAIVGTEGNKKPREKA
jgi:hypothetical protein